MTYIDGYLTPVPKAKKDKYVALAARAAAILKEYGATRIVECWHDEAGSSAAFYHAVEARAALPEQPSEEAPNFRRAANAGAEEIVVLSWVEWPNKEIRDLGMKKAMEDPRMQFTEEEPVFEGRRLIAGGFSPFLDV